ncbi:HAMP domain-containing sensor histidine kinase [Gudongella sp. DL1XJH-153]|uniref:HAMP domain-containing sensor histidine kinase n=1 Tax=Gudongella sp. DL1XJH-153 TaxID=3409804 RepID=UPI003BB50254
MDTRLKSFSRNNLTKAVAFLLIVAMVAGMAGIFAYWGYSEINPEVLLAEKYSESESYQGDLRNLAYAVVKVLEGERETIPGGIVFYGKNEENSISWPSNLTEEHFIKGDVEYYYLNEDRFTNSVTGETIVPYGIESAYEQVYFSLENAFLQQKQREWSTGRDALIPLAIASITMIVGTVMLLVYLFYVTGKKAQDEEIHLAPVDRIYTEVLFAGLLFAGFIWITSISNMLYISSSSQWTGEVYMSSSQKMALYMITGITALVTATSGVILLSSVRRIKAKRFFRSSFIYRVFYRGIVYLRSFLDGRRFDSAPLTRVLHQRQIYFIGGSLILVILTFILMMFATPLMLLPPILEVILIYWYFKYNRETFDEINKGFDESLEEKMKSERMKINLVTNVSHDLKTPLTSIISYVDLLSREEDLSDVSRDYIRILSEKSDRLKNIVSDLFDLARSTSGDIEIEVEELDLKKLVEQTVVDMDDSIQSSGFQVRTCLPEEPVAIRSDGKKLYRVLQNLLDNALKYSLQGTRIYVDLVEENGNASLRIKNTAGYEMNFTKDEILQRFFRGDSSRSGEGSGLGLSIAESFTRVSGGEFDLQVDGDQFNVLLKFPLDKK